MILEKYLAITLQSNDEAMLGLLSALPFDSFEETESNYVGYIAADAFTPEVESALNEITAKFNVQYNTDELEPQNWNEIWEATFQPIEVGHFCRVRADFHPPVAGFEYDLIINPKMAFGTGHHATTYMMIENMASINFKNKYVLDYGCGTGILAILASKSGADTVDAVDIEPESYNNTIENASINQVTNIHAFCGTLDAVPLGLYDIVLANINRNVLIDTIASLHERIKPQGILLISGILLSDKDAILHSFGQYNLQEYKITERDGWLAIAFQASSN